MDAIAVFPVQEVRERPDGFYDLLGAVWDSQTVESFPWEGGVRVAVLIRRSGEDRMPRHTLRVSAGTSSEGLERVISQQIPGLAAGTTNGILSLVVGVALNEPGRFTIAVQIDDGPIVTTEFKMRQA